MTEYELQALVNTATANIIEMTSMQGSYIAIYLSVVFAFIAASHVAGRDLNKLQTTIATVLFCIICVWLVNRITQVGMGINFLIEVNNTDNIGPLLERKGSDRSLSNQASIVRVAVTGGVWSLGMLGALVFLWDVRRSRRD